MKNFKKYLFSLSIAAITLIAAGCDEPEDFIFDGPNFVAFNDSSLEMDEDATDPINVSIGASVGGGVKQDVTVTYEVAGGNAVEGVDYRIVSPKTVTIPAGQNNVNVQIAPINNEVFNEARTIILKITAVSDPGLRIGFSDLETNQATVTINIINDDCPVNTRIWSGTISVRRVGTGTTHTSTAGPNAEGECNVLSLYTNAFGINAGARINRIEFTPASEGAKTGTVVVPKQNVGLRFTAPNGVITYEGEGTYDENTKIMTIRAITKREDGVVFRDDTYIFTGN